MPVLPKILYNFNENSATTIRDYSENGNDGTGTNLTIAASSRVGNDAVFNGATDVINAGNTETLNGVADCAFHFSIFINSGLLSRQIMGKTSQFGMQYNYTTNVSTFTLLVASGTASIDLPLSTSTWYDISFVYVGDVLTGYIDGVSTDTDSAQSGVVDTSDQDFIIGAGGGISSALFLLNEFKVFAEDISTSNIDAYIAEQNGVKITSSALHGYALGDIIGESVNTSNVTYAIVTFIESTTVFRLQPLTIGIAGSAVFQRVGHLWDTTRQWIFIIDDTPQICFYDGISKSTEVLTDAKKVYCMNTDGVIPNSSTITTTYQVLASDQRLYIDSSGGAFTITLEASPTTNRVLEIIDSVGSCGTNNVTIAGNGKNINGSASGVITSNYESWSILYNGTQHNLK